MRDGVADEAAAVRIGSFDRDLVGAAECTLRHRLRRRSIRESSVTGQAFDVKVDLRYELVTMPFRTVQCFALDAWLL